MVTDEDFHFTALVNEPIIQMVFNRNFELKDIDLFAFGNSQNSYTATRSIASYMKGIAVALGKPLIVIDENYQDEFQADKERLERLKASETEAEVKQYKEYKEKFNKARGERRKSEILLSNLK